MTWIQRLNELRGMRTPGSQVRTLLVRTHIVVRTPLMVRIA